MLGQLNRASKATKQRQRPQFPFKLRGILLIITVLLCSYTLSQAVSIYGYNQLNHVSCKASTILVMGAAQYNGVPSPAFQRRLDKALELYNNGCGSSFIVTGGAQVGDNYSEGLAGAAYLYSKGVPRSALLSETKSTTSYENLVFSLDLLQGREITIVTDDLHAHRTKYLAKKLGYIPEVVGAFTPYGRLMYGFKEFIKLTAYHLGIVR